MNNIVFTQLYYTERLKIPTCFDLTGIIFSESIVPAFFPTHAVPKTVCYSSRFYYICTSAPHGAA